MDQWSHPKPHGEPWSIDYFVRYVRFLPNGCWKWTGSTSVRTGYGSLTDKGRGYQAHRWAYEQMVGPVPAGLELDHLCRNRRCVNPDHLEPVTRRENIMRSPVALAAINARKTHCPRGHEYTPENTYMQGVHKTNRVCRACQRVRAAARRAAKAGA